MTFIAFSSYNHIPAGAALAITIDGATVDFVNNGASSAQVDPSVSPRPVWLPSGGPRPMIRLLASKGRSMIIIISFGDLADFHSIRERERQICTNGCRLLSAGPRCHYHCLEVPLFEVRSIPDFIGLVLKLGFSCICVLSIGQQKKRQDLNFFCSLAAQGWGRLGHILRQKCAPLRLGRARWRRGRWSSVINQMAKTY